MNIIYKTNLVNSCISFKFQYLQPRYVPSIRREKGGKMGSGSFYTLKNRRNEHTPRRISGISDRKTRMVTGWTACRRRWQPQSGGYGDESLRDISGNGREYVRVVAKRNKIKGRNEVRRIIGLVSSSSFSPPLQLLNRWRKRRRDKETTG